MTLHPPVVAVTLLAMLALLLVLVLLLFGLATGACPRVHQKDLRCPQLLVCNLHLPGGWLQLLLCQL
jgi:hypothetical protein